MAALIGISMKPKSQGGGVTVPVPLDLLAEDGTPPGQGDQVSFSVDGTVESVDEENATIKVDAVNGQPLTDESASEETAEDASSGAPPAGAPPPGGSAAMRPGLAKSAKAGSLGLF